MRANVKPLVHWAIFRKYTVRFRERTPQQVTGVLRTPDGEITFRYEPPTQTIHLPHESVRINDHGWELDEAGNIDTKRMMGGH